MYRNWRHVMVQRTERARFRWFISVLVSFFTIEISVISAADGLRYIGPRDADGSSAAVVVPDLPLGHTAQLLPVDSQGKLVGVGDAPRQIETVLSRVENAARFGNGTVNASIVKLHVVAANP